MKKATRNESNISKFILKDLEEGIEAILKTTSAYANFQDGVILLEIEDALNTARIANPGQFADTLTSKINDSIDPVPDYSISIDDTTKTVILSVKKRSATPYLYKGKAYELTHSSTVEVSRLKLKDLVLQGQNLYYDQLPVEEKGLTFSALEQEIVQKLDIPALDLNIHKGLGLYQDGHFTKAALLLSDQNQAFGIDIAVFGENLNTIRLRKTLDHQSLLESYQSALQVYKDYFQKEVIQGLVRSLEEEIPEVAVRQALVNGLVHRNWAVPAHILVRIFKDRLEITSPGALPEGVSESDYLEDRPFIPRNPLIAYLFFRLGYIERLGTGICRINEAYKQAEKKPEFLIGPNAITTILPVLHQPPEMTIEELNLYAAIKPNILFSRKELENQTALSRSKLTRLLNQLIEKKVIKVTGAGRATRYSRI